MRISDWSSDVCSSDLYVGQPGGLRKTKHQVHVLHRLARRPFYKIVLCNQNNQLITAFGTMHGNAQMVGRTQIGRASCRERVCQYVKIAVVAVSLIKERQESIEMQNTEQEQKNA